MSNRMIVNLHPDKAPGVVVSQLTYSYSIHIGGFESYTAIFLRDKRDLINFKNNFNQAYEALLRKEKGAKR